jgi:hypothetical protein
MNYEIAEHSASRLVVRRYWTGKGEGLHMLIGGIVLLVVGPFFAWQSLGNIAIGVTLLFAAGGPVGAIFIWQSNRQRRRIEEGLYVFDKRRGVFELSHRTERATTKFESYPLELVQAAVAYDISTEGYARRLVIVLRDNRSAGLFNWLTHVSGDAERASQVINEFLGIAPSVQSGEP